jgi:hypothetical protein
VKWNWDNGMDDMTFVVIEWTGVDSGQAGQAMLRTVHLSSDPMLQWQAIASRGKDISLDVSSSFFRIKDHEKWIKKVDGASLNLIKGGDRLTED